MKDRQPTDEERALWHRVVGTGGGLPSPAFVTYLRGLSDRYHFNKTTDLHGMTVQAASGRASAYVAEASRLGIKKVTVITGKSGQIRQEFPTWMELNTLVQSISEANGGGAFTVKLLQRK